MRSPFASLAPRLSPALLALALAACADGQAGPAPAPAKVARAVPMTAGDATPRLFAGGGDRVAAPTTVDAAKAYVARLAPGWGARAGTAALAPLATVKLQAGELVRLQQSIDGVVVHRRELRVLVRPDGTLGAASGVAVPADIVRRGRFALPAAEALGRALGATHGLGADPATLVTRAAADDEVWFASAPGAVPFVSEARAQKRWHHAGDHLVAAWVIEAYSAAGGDDTDSVLYRTVVAADSGEVLVQHRLTVDDVAYRVWADPGRDLRPLDGPTGDISPHPTSSPAAPRPAYVPPSLVTVDGLNQAPGGGSDPWLPAGATETRGNHVDAYTDLNAPDGLNGDDFRATTTAPGVFDRVYDPTRSPLASRDQQMAAITGLFYAINWLHDDWYDAGFTEAAGNAQADNFGRGGLQGDRMRAEAQDRANEGQRNNANMSTPGDGMSPRMQVYLWTGLDNVGLTVQPSGRTPATTGAAFTPRDYDLTGTLVLGADGTAPAGDGCQPLQGNVAGRVVLVDRGNCTFKLKALNAQTAGAIGLIIANNQGSTPPTLSNDPDITTVITIPVQGVSMAEGQTLKTAIAAGAVTVRLVRDADPDNDGSLDGGLVAHEYGHYIHHRLSDCNTKLCGAMSEGWGDFIAVHMLMRAGDDLDGTYAISPYASAGDDYFGIRRAPYSTRFDRNPLTFKHLAEGAPLPTSAPIRGGGSNSEVHNAGEIWAQMMWEAYVALQKAHADFDGTRRLMQRYIVEGLLMSPTDGTMTEVRDAILLAAFMNDPADHDVLAAAFARRGAGSCAKSPTRESADFTDVVESFELKPNSTATEPALAIDVEDCDGDGVLDVGETATVRTTVGNNGAAELTDVVVELTSTTPGLVVKTAPVTIDRLASYTSMPMSFEVTLTEGTAPIAGDLTLKVSAAAACTPELAITRPVRLNLDDQPMASTTDTFDSEPGAWTPDGPGADSIWSLARESALDGHWVGLDWGAPSETALVSPPMTAGDGAVTVELDHAYDFEFADDTFWDGGVIELSTDGGASWRDVATLADPGYDGAITDQSGNPLAGRLAFSGQSPGYPAKQRLSLALGSSLAGQTFQLRFLIGTDQAVGAGGWRIDDLTVTGLANKPFPTQGDDAGTCNPDVDPSDDGGCCQTGAPATGNLAAGLLVLGALAFRRRRRRPTAR